MIYSPEQKEEMLREAKIYSLSAPHLLPLLEKKKTEALSRLMNKYREGVTEYTTLVAEITVLTDLEREIKNKANMIEALQGER